MPDDHGDKHSLLFTGTEGRVSIHKNEALIDIIIESGYLFDLDEHQHIEATYADTV